MSEESYYNYIPEGTTPVDDDNVIIEATIKITGPDGFETGNLTSDDIVEDTFTPESGVITGGYLVAVNKSRTDNSDSQGGRRAVQSKGAKSKTVAKLPSPFKDKFKITIYYCPLESGFNYDAGFNMEDVVTVSVGGASYVFQADFIRATNTEGIGKMVNPIGGNYYLASNDNGATYNAIPQPVGNAGNPLVAKSSCAIGGGSPIPRRGKIKINSMKVQNAFGTQNFSVADTGGGLLKLQIDLYWGEDNPHGTGGGIFFPSGTNFTGDTNAVVILQR